MLAIIGGTGLYNLDQLKIIKQQIVDTPFGKTSAPLIYGEYKNYKIIFLARNGKNHELLPHEIYKLSDKYPTKTKWIIRWFKNEIPSLIFFNVKAGVSKVIIKYKEIVIERGA